jgi:hypothetical protein
MLNKKLLGSVSSLPSDENFENVSLLLSGDGTNGAQNNTFLDSSTNNFSITRNGNTTQGSFSPYGNLWSNYLSGASGNYISVANNTNLIVGSGDFTIECWVNMSAVNGSNANPIISKCASNSTTGWLLSSSSGGLWQFADYFGNNLIRAGTVVVGAWTHLAVTRSGSTVTLWVNGTSVGTASYSTNFSDTTALMVGYSADYVYTNAYVSNVRLVKGTAVYTSSFTPSTTPLTAITNTQLLTCQSNRFIDNSANNFTVTPNGTPSVQRFSPFNPTAPYSTSVIGGSGYFDGSGDYLTLPSGAADFMHQGATNWTCEFYFYATSDVFQTIYSTTGNSGAIGFNISLSSRATGDIEFQSYYNSAGNGYFNYTSAGVWKINTWNHVAITFNGTSKAVIIYLNGVSQALTTSGTASFNSSTASNVPAIGRLQLASGSGYNMFGYLSNMRSVNNSLVYTGNFTPPTAPVTAVTNTQLLTNFTNAGIPDLAMINNLETVGNAQVSTSVKKYGTGSLAFDGTGDYLKFAPIPSVQLGGGDFTVEGWFYANSPVPQYGYKLYAQAWSGTNYFLITLGDANGGNTNNVSCIINGTSINSSTTFSTGTWNHFAVVRNSGSVKIYLNGVAGSGTSNTTNLNNLIYPIGIGSYTFATGEQYNGYLDDLRITKGLARYTANFTPPASALPTF